MIYIVPQIPILLLIPSTNTRFESTATTFMNAQDIINLFDLHWFNLEIFGKNSITSSSPIIEANPYQENQKNHSKDLDPVISKLPSIHLRPENDQSSSTSRCFPDPTSPNSVLCTQKESMQTEESKLVIKESKRVKSRRKNMHSSKSIAQLELEELKGLLDLGFLFREEDKNTKLVDIIPGLRRWGKKKEETRDDNLDESSSAVTRPYLSEAWGVLNIRDRDIPVIKCNVSDLNKDADVKKSLKLWAHKVAATLIRY